jgi:hypothetical protein
VTRAKAAVDVGAIRRLAANPKAASAMPGQLLSPSHHNNGYNAANEDDGQDHEYQNHRQCFTPKGPPRQRQR